MLKVIPVLDLNVDAFKLNSNASIPTGCLNSQVNGNFMIAKTLHINEKDVAGLVLIHLVIEPLLVTTLS